MFASCDPMDCSPPDSSVHGIYQAGILEWVALSFSREIFPTQGSNPGLLYCRWILNQLNHRSFPLLHVFSSVQFSRSVVSNSLRPHESQHTRPPCPSPTPRVHLNSRPSSRWCHPAISSSVVPFSCPQSLPASESFPMSQVFAWGGQRLEFQL